MALTNTFGDWEIIRPLGEGGQSEVYLARSPERTNKRKSCLDEIKRTIEGAGGILTPQMMEVFANSIFTFSREDAASELGALKMFNKTRDWGAPAQERFKRELQILGEKRPNLPRLLDSNEKNKWLVTEFFLNGSLDKSPHRFSGDADGALRAFRKIVETVAQSLHKDGIVHRDIKPANVFLGTDGNLVLGDFGIAYLPQGDSRMTITNERVGPWDYMPQWGDMGNRLDEVQPNFDVYMLGKLLWCMIAGRLRLPREYQRRPEFDLTVIFSNDWRMEIVNTILDKCLVEEPAKFLSSATELLDVVDAAIASMTRGAQIRVCNGKVEVPCAMCGKGKYVFRDKIQLQPLDERSRTRSPILLEHAVCSVCAHYCFFAPGYPQEGAKAL